MTEHPPFRQEALAAFSQLAMLTGQSRRSLRDWLADEMGIDLRYCIVADMDQTECQTVVDVCRERIDAILKQRKWR